MAAYIAVIFYTTMVAAALFMDVAFTALGLVPQSNPDIRAELTHFSLNYTFWLNVACGIIAAYLFWLAKRHPMEHTHHHAHTADEETHRRHYHQH